MLAFIALVIALAERDLRQILFQRMKQKEPLSRENSSFQFGVQALLEWQKYPRNILF